MHHSLVNFKFPYVIFLLIHYQDYCFCVILPHLSPSPPTFPTTTTLTTTTTTTTTSPSPPPPPQESGSTLTLRTSWKHLFSHSRTARRPPSHLILLRETRPPQQALITPGGGGYPHSGHLGKWQEDLTARSDVFVILAYSDTKLSSSSSSSSRRRRRRRRRKPDCSIYLDTVEAVFTVPRNPHLPSSLPHIPHQSLPAPPPHPSAPTAFIQERD